ncbi:RCC1 domain-containing protein [Leifsonia xyli]|nr:RCC1 domain-containing protein [Leifsonia xyli]
MQKFFIPPRRRRWGRAFTWLLASLCALAAVAVAGSPVAVSWAMWAATSSNTGDSWNIASFCTAPAALPATGAAQGGTRVALNLTAAPTTLTFTAVDGGNGHSFALAPEGTVWAWGYDGYGQLGDGGTSRSSTPVPVKGLDGKAAAIGDGSDHSLALTSRGAVWAWGRNFFGQLGNNTTISSIAPVQVKAADRTVSKATGVVVGGNAAADVVMVDCPKPTVIFTVPAHAAGATDITVTTQTKSGTPGPTLTYLGGFTYTT